MLKKTLLILLLILGVSFPAFAGQRVPDWKSWSQHVFDAPRLTADQVADSLIEGEKTVFVYAGYQVKEVLCSSLYLPYKLVPPFSDGSRVNLPDIPKDTMMIVY